MEKQFALIYARVSSERQKNEGHGLEGQEHRCREYAQQKGYEIEKVFLDSYTGGGNFMNRPAMSALLAHIDNNPSKKYVVIFDDLKRFARDMEFHLKLRVAFRNRSTKLECLNFNFDDSPTGRFAEMVMAAAAELEKTQGKIQVRQKMQARLEKGYWTFYPPPGLKHSDDPIHGKLLVFDEPRASIIKEAFEGFASGRFQEQADVQIFLQERDFCDGQKIYLTKIKRLFERVIYAGYIEYPEWEVSRRKGHHQALISLETYEKVQERLSGKSKIFTRKDITEDFPARGFILCSLCFRSMTASWSKGRKEHHPYYRCNTAECPNRNKSIRRKDLEDKLMTVLRGVEPKEETLNLTKAIFMDVWNKRSERAEEVERIRSKELLKISEEVSGLLQRISKAQNERVVKAYEVRIEELSKQEQVLREKNEASTYGDKNFETALSAVIEFLKKPISIWQNGGLNDKRRVLKLVFAEKLVYDYEKGFETAKLSMPLRVFQLSAASKSQGVEMVEVESTSENFSN